MRPKAIFIALAWAFSCTISIVGQQGGSLSPREQLTHYIADLQKNPSDDALREKIIKLALTLDPKPAAPPEVDELAGRAQYIFEHANSPDDLLKAASAFEDITHVVPWLPDYYFDAAVVYEKANRPADALKNYKFSVMAYLPNSEDAKKVREKIGALSYVLEQQQAAAHAEQARRDAETQAERQRELAAEQAREQTRREEQQRLANLDPIVRQLDGALFVSKLGMGTVPESYETTTYTIHGDSVSEEVSWQYAPNKRNTYQINGRQFDMGQYQIRDRCDDGRIITERDTVGTIAADAITFMTRDSNGQICWHQVSREKANRVK
jgi:hypothetical protein